MILINPIKISSNKIWNRNYWGDKSSFHCHILFLFIFIFHLLYLCFWLEKDIWRAIHQINMLLHYPIGNVLVCEEYVNHFQLISQFILSQYSLTFKSKHSGHSNRILSILNFVDFGLIVLLIQFKTISGVRINEFFVLELGNFESFFIFFNFFLSFPSFVSFLELTVVIAVLASHIMTAISKLILQLIKLRPRGLRIKIPPKIIIINIYVLVLG